MSDQQPKKPKKKGKKSQSKDDGFTVVTKNKTKYANGSEDEKASYNDLDDITLNELEKVGKENLKKDEDDIESDFVVVGVNSCSNNSNVGLEVNFTPNRYESLSDQTVKTKKSPVVKQVVNTTDQKKAKEQQKKDLKFSDIVKQPSNVETANTNKVVEPTSGSSRNVVDIVKNRVFIRKNKVLIIIRGLPGSGKTTLAKKLVFSGQILAPEDYKKNFDKHYGTMDKCYEWIKEKVEECMKKGVNPIVIDNVHGRAVTVVPYVELAQIYRYYAMIEEPDTAWKFNARECANRNTHNVPLEKIKQILLKYDRVVTVDGVLKMIFKYHAKNGTIPRVFAARQQNRANSISSTDNEEETNHELKVDMKNSSAPKSTVQVNLGDAIKTIKNQTSTSASPSPSPSTPKQVTSSNTTPVKSSASDPWEKLKRAEDLSLSSGTILPTIPKDKASTVNVIEKEMAIVTAANGESSSSADMAARNGSCSSPYGSIGDMAEMRTKPPQQIHDTLFNAGTSYELDNIDLDEEFLAFEANLDQKISDSPQNFIDDIENEDLIGYQRDGLVSNLKHALDQQDREFMPSLFNVEPAPYNTMGLVPPGATFDGTNAFMLNLMPQASTGILPSFNQFSQSSVVASLADVSPTLSMLNMSQGVPNPQSINDLNFIANDLLNTYPTFADSNVMSGLATSFSQSNLKSAYPAQDYPSSRRVKMSDASTSTTPKDFNILHCIQEGIPYDQSRVIDYKIIQSLGNGFIPSPMILPTEIRTQSRQADKWCNTMEDVSMSLNIDFLSTCFPNIGRNDLGRILDSCNGDVDKTIDVLLDWGYDGSVTIDSKRQLLVTQLSNSEEADVPLSMFDSKSHVKSLFDISAECVIRFGIITDAELQQQVITSSEQRLKLWSSPSQVTGISIPMTRSAIQALESVFGLLPQSANYGGVEVILPIELARCVYECLGQSLAPKRRSPLITENDEFIASQLQQDEWHLPGDQSRHSRSATPVTSLRDIMAEEAAQKISRDHYWKTQEPPDSALIKWRISKLQSLFPGVSESWLSTIFDKYNYNIDATVKYLCATLNISDPRLPTSTSLVHNYSLSTTKGTSGVDGLASSQFQTTHHPDYEDFRKEALLHHQLRDECFRKSQQAFRRGWKDVASYYSQEGHKHTKKMREANLHAADTTFQYRNEARDDDEIDLHGLHAEEVGRILKRELEVRRVKGLLKVKIITGRGTHSAAGKSRVAAAVSSYLRTHQYKFSMPHDGAVDVRLQRL